MKMSIKKFLFAVSCLSFITLPALAHTDAHPVGFWAGLVHPFTGVDHLIAMILLGVWFATLTKTMAVKSGLASVSIFALGLFVGGSLPSTSIAAIEWAVLFSGIAVGLLILFRMQLGQLAPVAAASLMASHGLVHGTEVTGNLMGYALGACGGMLVLIGLAYAVTASLKHFRATAYSR